VILQIQPVLADGDFVWGYGLVTDGHPEGLPCSGLVARLLHGLDGRTTVAESIAKLCQGLEPAATQQVERAALDALQILYVDGAICTSP
jgi:hypothetical protein